MGAAPLQLASGVVPAAERYPAAYFVEEVKQWILDDPRFGATPQGAPRPPLRRRAPHPDHRRPRDAGRGRGAVAAILPDPTAPPLARLIEPATGYVRAMVGGRDFFGTSPNAKLNLATQAGAHSGSSFKPLVLAAALEQGIDPLRPASAPRPASRSRSRDQAVAALQRRGGAARAVTIAEGTVRSYNTLYAQLIMRVGPKAAMEERHALGIRSPLEPCRPAVLGSNDVTAMDMASAYATFANRGVHVPPVLVTRITRADGTVLYDPEHNQEKVLSADMADTVTTHPRAGDRAGHRHAAKLDRPAAGKTGTTDEYNDAWFAGYTPRAGHRGVGRLPARQQVSMRPPNTPIPVTGGTYPAQIWQRFMSAALAGAPPSAFRLADHHHDGAAVRGDHADVGLGPSPAVPDVVGLRGGGHRGPRAAGSWCGPSPRPRAPSRRGSSRCSHPPGAPAPRGPRSPSRSPRARPRTAEAPDRFGQLGPGWRGWHR